MVIVIANQKGGVGKSTICVLFANYISTQIKTIVVDMDFQQSIHDRREHDLNTYENPIMYDVVKSQDGDEVVEFINKVDNDETLILIDTPGRIDNDNILGVLKAAHYIIVPIHYDKLTMNSTDLFIKLINYLKLDAKLIFVPNKIKATVKYQTKEQIHSILNNVGVVAPKLSEKIALERLNTLENSKDVTEIINKSFSFIVDYIQK